MQAGGRWGLGSERRRGWRGQGRAGARQRLAGRAQPVQKQGWGAQSIAWGAQSILGEKKTKQTNKSGAHLAHQVQHLSIRDAPLLPDVVPLPARVGRQPGVDKEVRRRPSRPRSRLPLFRALLLLLFSERAHSGGAPSPRPPSPPDEAQLVALVGLDVQVQAVVALRIGGEVQLGGTGKRGQKRWPLGSRSRQL